MSADFLWLCITECVDLLMYVVLFSGTASILNMIWFKIKDGEPIFAARPRCSLCTHEIHHLDVLPILGYLRTRGRCRYCNQTYSKQHIIVECIGAALGVAAFVCIKIALRS